jgi:hypothetical protein
MCDSSEKCELVDFPGYWVYFKGFSTFERCSNSRWPVLLCYQDLVTYSSISRSECLVNKIVLGPMLFITDCKV